VNIARVGVSYHFGGPVVAKYFLLNIKSPGIVRGSYFYCGSLVSPACRLTP
jgi:hypothetical protein